jgi:hypothetical protein
MDNLGYWEKLKRPPPEALRQIQAGRLRGKTDINPQWRYRAMTEVFGPCGIGWKWELVKLWTEPAPEGQVFAFAQVCVYIKNGEWSEPIPGIGGSMLVDKESSGLHASDEAYKMAVTDALSVAMKMVGVGADIYAGLWDGNKYNGPPTQGQQPKPAAPTQTTPPPVQAQPARKPTVANPDDPITGPQSKAIHALLTKLNITDDLERMEHISRIAGIQPTVTSTASLTKGEASTVIEALGKELEV